jgi:class 3 adenylate cyclase
MSETRKIAAILVADVVGYSRLAGADEDRILARLRALRSDLIDPTIAVHKGRVVKRTGDGALISYLATRGILVVPFSYPVVSRGGARIRMQVSAAHEEADISRVVEVFGSAKHDLGV